MRRIKESKLHATNAEDAGKLRVLSAVGYDAKSNRPYSDADTVRMEISTKRQTREEERQFGVALDLFLDEMVREVIEGRNGNK